MRLFLSSFATALLASSAAAQFLPPPVAQEFRSPAILAGVDVIGMAIDRQDNIYFCGQTSQTIEGATQYGPRSLSDMVVLKFAPTGQQLLYATIVGGSRNERCVDLKLDEQGNVYGIGATDSTDYPYTAFYGTGFPNGPFLFKLDAAGQVVYNVLPGWIYSLSGFELGSAGSVYFGGTAFSGKVPVHTGAYRSIPAPDLLDAFVAKLNASGAIEAATYVGEPGLQGLVGTRPFRRLVNGDIHFLSASSLGTMDSGLSMVTYSRTIEQSQYVGADAAGILYLTSYRENHVVLSKYSSDGRQLLSQREYLYGGDVRVHPTGTVFISNSGHGGWDFPVQNALQPCAPNLPSPYANAPTLTMIQPDGEVAYASFYLAYFGAAAVGPVGGQQYVLAEFPNAQGGPWRGIVRLDPAYRPAAHISAGCLVHSATLNPADVSPGTLMTLFGDRIGAGSSVTVDGKPAPILYSASRQINFIVPWSTRTGVFVPICVTAGGETSCLHSWTARMTPGFFRTGSSIAAINPNGTVNSQSNPAPSGSYISLYLTGAGALEKTVGDGGIAGVPLVRLAGRVTAQMVHFLPPCSMFGCGTMLNAEVLYAGAVPTLPYGMTVVILRIPAAIAPGNRGVILTFADATISGQVWVGP